MSLEIAAKHLASKGRGPDTQLVHMSPREVAGLQALAMAQGGSLSINPETGLPEAGFLDNMLPAIIGAGLAFATGGTSLALTPAMIGLGVGGVQTLRTGDLGKGIMAGLGAYGGAGLAAPFAAAGPGFTVASPQAASQATALAEAAPAARMGVTGAEALYPTLPPPEVYANPFVDAAGQAYGANMPLESPLRNIYETAGGGFEVMPDSLNYPTPAVVESFKPLTNVYSDQELAARLMSPVEMTGTPAASSANLMAPVEVTGTPSPSTANLMSPVEMTGTPPPSGLQALKMMPGKDLAKYGLSAAAPALLAQPEYKQPELDREQYRYAYTPGRVADPYAKLPAGYRGEVEYFRPQYTRLAEGGLADLSTGVERYALGGFFNRLKNREAGADTGQYAYDPITQSYASGLGGLSGAYNYTYDPTTQSYTSVAPPPAPAEAAGAGEYQPTYGQVDYGAGMARGGISHLGDYSDGGRLLRGPGDGVSDSIPATIGDKRPARLADGEFVVPARIVSELGNGSTEAGARKLYAMMDRIQRARGKTTGKGKVAKNTRADNYLPA